MTDNAQGTQQDWTPVYSFLAWAVIFIGVAFIVLGFVLPVNKIVPEAGLGMLPIVSIERVTTKIISVVAGSAFVISGTIFRASLRTR